MVQDWRFWREYRRSVLRERRCLRLPKTTRCRLPAMLLLAATKRWATRRPPELNWLVSPNGLGLPASRHLVFEAGRGVKSAFVHHRVFSWVDGGDVLACRIFLRLDHQSKCDFAASQFCAVDEFDPGPTWNAGSVDSRSRGTVEIEDSEPWLGIGRRFPVQQAVFSTHRAALRPDLANAIATDHVVPRSNLRDHTGPAAGCQNQLCGAIGHQILSVVHRREGSGPTTNGPPRYCGFDHNKNKSILPGFQPPLMMTISLPLSVALIFGAAGASGFAIV